MDKTVNTDDEAFSISFDVTNEEQYVSDEVVEVYLSPEDKALPLKPIQLIAFDRVPLQPGEKKTVSFRVSPQQLGYYAHRQWHISPGHFRIKVGASSQDIRLTDVITLKGKNVVMSSFNDISGIPATTHQHLLTDVLKKRWGMNGFVISDWDGVKQLVNQGFAADRKDCAEKAINAGLDVDMNSGCYQDYLVELVNEGKVDIARVDDAVRRVLRLKFTLGLFENPYTKEQSDEKNFLLPEYRAQAEKLAEETMVLLKNQNGTLPLQKKKIAVVGPLAKTGGDLIGNWHA